MQAETVEAIPLYPRRRFIGSRLGGFTSARRGEGADVAGSRPYQPGDRFHAIDWKSSARLSAARGTDEFIVRERFEEEMPRIVIVCDKRPEMALFPSESPWLHKLDAVAYASDLLVASALNQRGLVGYLDFGSHAGESEAGEPSWRPPRAQSNVWSGNLLEATRRHLEGDFDAPPDNLDRALRFLAVVGGVVPSGSFLFVCSDFLERPSVTAWAAVAERGWDIVPIVVQDPFWEQSFPPVGGVVAPVTDPRRARLLYVHLTRREAEARAATNEQRLGDMLAELIRYGLDPILISSSERGEVCRTLLAWAEQRFEQRGHGT
jgi:hypothetical protein